MKAALWVGACCGLVVLGVELVAIADGSPAAMLIGGLCVACGLAVLHHAPRGER